MRLAQLVTLFRDRPHTLDPCQCWRCVAHRLALQQANRQHTANAVYAEHLQALIRRCQRKALRLVAPKKPA